MGMREEFEAVITKSFSESGRPVPSFARAAWGYKDSAIQSAWWGFEKGWQASRAALVIDLSEARNTAMTEYDCELTVLERLMGELSGGYNFGTPRVVARSDESITVTVDAVKRGES